MYNRGDGVPANYTKMGHSPVKASPRGQTNEQHAAIQERLDEQQQNILTDYYNSLTIQQQRLLDAKAQPINFMQETNEQFTQRDQPFDGPNSHKYNGTMINEDTVVGPASQRVTN